MKKFLLALLPMTFSVFAQPQLIEINTITKPANTLIREHSSENNARMQTMLLPRKDYPTQIVRMHGFLTGEPQTCEEVFKKIDVFFNNQITYDRFFYNTIDYCSYDPKTNFATSFTINSYFDPRNDEAITYLEKYLAEHNGHDLLGLPFTVESAQGVIVSLDLDAGIEEGRNDNSIILLRHDNAAHFFSSNYKMRLELLKDADQRLFTHDANLVLPFIGKWLLTPGGIYYSILGKANYVELRPELIFLMDKDPKIFTPLLKLYYANHCSKYVNKHCL